MQIIIDSLYYFESVAETFEELHEAIRLIKKVIQYCDCSDHLHYLDTKEKVFLIYILENRLNDKEMLKEEDITAISQSKEFLEKSINREGIVVF